MAGARALRMLALALLLGALATGALAVARGDLRVALFLLFPVFYGTGPLGLLTVLLLLAAMIAWFFSAVAGMRGHVWPPEASGGARDPRLGGRGEPDAARRTRHGGVVLLGPIPIVWGSDRGMARGMMIAGLVLVALLVAYLVLAR